MRSCIFAMKLLVCSMLLLSLQSHGVEAAPVKKDRKYYETRGQIVWEVPTDEKLIAITFDDGPDPRYTPIILDLLKQYSGKSTFFTIGNRVEQFPELAKRAVEEGHELSNHTFSHLYLRNGISSKQYLNEILKTQEVIKNLTGHLPTLFRPPGGYYNDTVINAANEVGIQVVLWSWHQDTKDWKNPGVDKIVNKVLNNVRNGDIILMHDHVRHDSQTVEALKIILPELQQRGYKLVTVSELLSHHKMFRSE